MTSQWRLLDTGVQRAPFNMALEKVLLASCAGGTAPNTLHLLEFFPCVLLGYSQSAENEINENYCMAHNIEINRRIGGGGCIYMDGGTLGWEIIAKKNAPGIISAPGIPGGLNEMYSKLCGAVVAALANFALSAVYRPLNDVEINGRKISGTGGTELDDSFIFHGTILVDFDAGTMSKALKIPVKKKHGELPGIKQRTICMKELLGQAPPMDEVKKSLTKAFAQTLGIEFIKSGLLAEEIKSLNEELPLFSSEKWIYGKESNK